MEILKKQLAVVSLMLGIFLSCCGYAYASCTGGVLAGSISTTISWQTIPCVKAGEYFTFNAVSNKLYTFSFCMGGGSASWNTKITILDNSGNPSGIFADDDCGPSWLQSHLWNWSTTTGGIHRVLITQMPSCQSNNICAVLAYKEELAPGGAGITCANPWVIPSIPYTQTGLTTCGFDDDYNSTHRCNSTYMNTEDFVLTFNGTAGQCISIFTRNTFIYTGLFLVYGCPSNAGSTCVRSVEASAGNPQSTNITLPSTGQYFIIVAMSDVFGPMCTPFDIEVLNCVAVGVGFTCANPFIIPSLPYVQVGHTTCGYGNNYNSTMSCTSNYMNGEDFVFRYVSPGNECINVNVSNSFSYTGFHVVYGCPNSGGTCIASRGLPAGNPRLRTIQLTAAGTYHIIVSTYPPPACTPFNISITNCGPGCTRNPNLSDNCNAPANLVSIGLGDTICGFSNMNFTADSTASLNTNFCGSIENNGWFRFVADSTQMTIRFDVSNCNAGLGIQVRIFQTSNCSTFVPVSNCWNPQVQANGIVQATGLTVGSTYYMMVDGYAADDCEFTAYRISGPFPVKWGSFSAQAVGKEVKLDWSTAQEMNNKGFFVQRGKLVENGTNDNLAWEDLTFVPGKGDSEFGHQYSHADRPPYTGMPYFYRIHQIDFDGASDFTDPIRVEIAGPDQSTLFSVVPNPAKDHVIVEYYAAKSGSTAFALYDISGKIVTRADFIAGQPGMFHQNIALENLGAGMYFYLLNVNGTAFKGKLSIMH